MRPQLSTPGPVGAAPVGLASLLTALRPRIEPEPPPPPPLDLDAVRQAAWDTGFAAGAATENASLAPLRAQLADAAAALHAACTIDVDLLRPLFVALVTGIAESVLDAELGAGAAVLMPLVNAALAEIRPGETATLRAHPDTLAALRSHLSDIVIAADASLARDAFAVTAPHFLIEAGLSARLDAIVRGLA
jgi:flagellar assembly protein FliH